MSILSLRLVRNVWTATASSILEKIKGYVNILMRQYTSMAGIEIIAVEGGPQLKNFIDLPWRIYAEYPNWIPP